MTSLKSTVKQYFYSPLVFAENASGLKLRSYQQQVALAVADSILHRKGFTFVVIFPRQSGKNELQAQIESYLLVLFSEYDVEIVKVSPTWKPQSLNAMRRLERVLNRNLLTKAIGWKKEQGYIYRVGLSRIFFLSGSPTASVVGATASLLLECDEAQDVLISKWDKELNPMAASTNATRLFWGTAWTSQTLLAREKRAALEAQQQDGVQRLFEIDADLVGSEVPAYQKFVQGEITRLGSSHPFVLTQYFSKEIDAEAGMFPASRQALMRGTHAPLTSPIHSFVDGGGQGGGLYVFTIDVAGSDETSNDVILSPHLAKDLSSPNDSPLSIPPLNGEASPESRGGTGVGSRDSSALTIFEIDLSTLKDPLINSPTYLVRSRFLWTNISQTELYSRITALIKLWKPYRTVVDATGIGAGLASFLFNSYPGVIQFQFTQKSKSDLGWSFITVIESGRFKDYNPSPINLLVDGGGVGGGPTSLQSLFFTQLTHCQMEIQPGPTRLIKWGVSPGSRDPSTRELIHDDLVISAALCSILDHETWGLAESDIVSPPDIFSDMSF